MKNIIKKNIKGFTFIELMLAVTLMGLSFFPIMHLFASALDTINTTSEMSTALNLAREGMEMVRNLNLPTKRLEDIGSYVYPKSSEPPIFLNNNEWRIHTIIHKGTSPLEVEIKIYKNNDSLPNLELVTLFEDLY